jgi:hypothetical protein
MRGNPRSPPRGQKGVRLCGGLRTISMLFTQEEEPII